MRNCANCKKKVGYKKSKYCSGICLRRYRTKMAVVYNKFKNDNCEECDIKEARLVVHHKDRDFSNNNPDNLQTLCTKCHGKKHRDHHSIRVNPESDYKPIWVPEEVQKEIKKIAAEQGITIIKLLEKIIKKKSI